MSFRNTLNYILIGLSLGILIPDRLVSQVVTPGHADYDYLRVLNILQSNKPLFSNYMTMVHYDRSHIVQGDVWGWYAQGRNSLSQSSSVRRNDHDTVHVNGSNSGFWGSIEDGTLRWLPISTKTTFNSTYAKSMNNGPLWYGRGLTQEIHAGFQFRKGILDVTFQPVLFYSQNRDFELLRNPIFPLEFEKSEYSYPLEALVDYVIRYGDSPFVKFHPGQSDVSLRAGKFRVGVSTQNMVVGPSWYNPILMSMNAPGFPHLYFSSREPISTRMGHVEFRQVWGGLRESAYFDDDSGNDWRYFAGLYLGIEPNFAPGLHVGINRTFIQQGRQFNILSKDPIVTLLRFRSEIVIEDNTTDLNDDFDQLASVTGRWTFPETGFEAHFEFAINDFGGGIFGPQPDHSRAYTVGFTKLFERNGPGILAVTGEITNTAVSRTGMVRPPGSYYVHMEIEQGYTHLGQILGSGMGPAGALGWSLFVRNYNERGMKGLFAGFQRINDDFYFLYFDNKDQHDFEHTIAWHQVWNMQRMQIQLQAGYSRRSNMNMVRGNNVNQIQISFGIRI